MEVTDLSDQLEVHYPDGVKSQFSVPLLALSLTAVLVNRPDHADDAFWLAQTIAEQLYQQPKRPITPDVIARAAYDVLDRYDPAAALQYGARYRVFESSIRRRSIRRKT
jgi:transcriptional regulator NrdR family protein